MATRTYAGIRPTLLWAGVIGRKLRLLPFKTRLVAVYLLTAPASTYSGLYYLSLASLTAELGLSADDARVALGSLEEADFARYDEENEVVWVKELIHHDSGEHLAANDNRLRGIPKDAEKCSRSLLYPEFLAWFSGWSKRGSPPSPYPSPSVPSPAQPGPSGAASQGVSICSEAPPCVGRCDRGPRTAHSEPAASTGACVAALYDAGPDDEWGLGRETLVHSTLLRNFPEGCPRDVLPELADHVGVSVEDCERAVRHLVNEKRAYWAESGLIAVPTS